jgi:hypothetical protein
MNPLFKQRGMTPTAAIAYRAKAQETRLAQVAKIKASAEANSMSLSRDGLKNAGKAKLAAKAKLGSDGKPESTKVIWDPKTKTVTRV